MINKEEIRAAALALTAAEREALAEELLFSVSGFHNRRADAAASTELAPQEIVAKDVNGVVAIHRN